MEGAQGSKLCKPSSHDKKTEVIINLTLTRILPPPLFVLQSNRPRPQRGQDVYGEAQFFKHKY